MPAFQSAPPAVGASAEGDVRPLAAARVEIPHHVVYRSFPSETVVLNLETGKYHGLNPTAGAMLAALERTGSARGAAAELAPHYGKPRSEVEQDVCMLCVALLERGLVKLDGPTAG